MGQGWGNVPDFHLNFNKVDDRCSMSKDKQINFTIQSLQNLPLPTKGFSTYRDAKSPYLQVYVTTGGTKTFFVRKSIKGQNRRVKIGLFPAISIEQARKQALVLVGLVSSGQDPHLERQKERLDKLTFGEHFQDYMERYSKLHKKTWKYDQVEIERHCGHWFNRRLSDISKNDVQRLHEKIGKNNGRVQANTIARRLSSIFNKAILWGWDGKNPVTGIQKFKEKSRDRFIQPHEMRFILKHLQQEPNETFRDFFWILLMTGMRKTNTLQMRWDQINLELKEWRVPDSKNGDPIYVHLVDKAYEILKKRRELVRSPWVFPQDDNPKEHIFSPWKNWKNILASATLEYWNEDVITKEWIDQKICFFRSYVSPKVIIPRLIKIAEEEGFDLPTPFTDLRIHDIRRTFGSYQAMTGVSLTIIGKTLGHRSINSTKIYARLHIDPVKDAVNKATNVILDFG